MRRSCRRGRPGSKAARRAARRKKRIAKKVGDLFEHRYLFVQRHLSRTGRATLLRITRGLPHLRVLRELMDEVYRLFDRRCRTATAVARLACVADAVATVRLAAVGAEEAALAGAGEGAGVPGRAAAGHDLERGGAWQPALPQDAEDGVPSADTASDRGPSWRWTSSGSVRPEAGLGRSRRSTRRGRHDVVTRYPCYSVQFFDLRATLYCYNYPTGRGPTPSARMRSTGCDCLEYRHGECLSR